jgi:hypothetical protein
MAAIYDEQVRNQLYEYEQSLKDYPTSVDRRREKLKLFRLFLQGLSDFSNKFSSCDKKKMEKKMVIFDKSNN